MNDVLRMPAIRYAAFILAAFAATFLLLPELRNKLLAANFLPHATCYLQNPQLIWLHATSDTVIGASYVAIASTLAYLVYRARSDIPFHWMFLSFGLFIVTCGFTHFLEVWTVWQPVYWLAGFVKLVTGIASLATAIVLPPLVPKVIHLIKSAKISEERKIQLEAANGELRLLYNKVKEADLIKTQFFANISHELRTPLTLILAPVRRMSAEPNLTEPQRQSLATVERNAGLLLNQVNQLLDAAKLEAGKMELHYREFDLAELVRRTAAQFESMAHQRQIRLQIDTPPTLIAQLDEEKMERVLLNLLSNAFKFVPDAGTVTCQLARNDHSGELIVRDTGPGIPADSRETVFERFRQLDGGATRKRGGTGLGLPIAREFMELQRGRIWVGESRGGGAAFHVEFPLKAPEGTNVTKTPELPAPPQAAIPLIENSSPGPASDPDTPLNPSLPTVLVVEDNPELNQFISQALAEEHNVLRASTGREGLAKARETNPDVVLTDLMMPELSGDQLLAEMRQENALQDTPVIVLTAKADEKTAVSLLRSGAQDFLVKPFSVEELRARLSSLAAMSRTRRVLQEALARGTGQPVELARELVRQKEELEKARNELKWLNDQLEQRVEQRTHELSELNDELKAFNFSVSHDLRAPLRTIRGMTQILLELLGENATEEIQQYSQRILAGADRMDSLLENLLHYSRVGRGAVEITTLNTGKILQEVVADLQADIQSRNARVTLPAHSLPVPANDTFLKQCLHNLIANAIYYVPPERAPEIRILTEDRADKIRIWVEDNGAGIKPEYQQKIFEPFVRLHNEEQQKGTGLGLSIVKRAVRRMGGETGVESIPGEGSRFWIDLPKPGSGS